MLLHDAGCCLTRIGCLVGLLKPRIQAPAGEFGFVFLGLFAQILSGLRDTRFGFALRCRIDGRGPRYRGTPRTG